MLKNSLIIYIVVNFVFREDFFHTFETDMYIIFTNLEWVDHNIDSRIYSQQEMVDFNKIHDPQWGILRQLTVGHNLLVVFIRCSSLISLISILLPKKANLVRLKKVHNNFCWVTAQKYDDNGH